MAERAKSRVRWLASLAILAMVLALPSARATSPPPAGDDDYVPIELVLRLGERRLYVIPVQHDHDPRHALASFPVAVGRDEYATPTGRFKVKEKLVDPPFQVFDWNDPDRVLKIVEAGPANPLGQRWIGFATSEFGWQIGFHGTPNPELLGRAVSHGCVRMRNRDVVDLYGRVEVGTPVIVEP
jgi:lipoprotein-anchoring transpeptidase ErfK/SrfK